MVAASSKRCEKVSPHRLHTGVKFGAKQLNIFRIN
jgi:hypothetical protein